MKIAACNLNGVDGRLPVLVKWLKVTKPDIVCMQELKMPGEKFPQKSQEAISLAADDVTNSSTLHTQAASAEIKVSIVPPS